MCVMIWWQFLNLFLQCGCRCSYFICPLKLFLVWNVCLHSLHGWGSFSSETMLVLVRCTYFRCSCMSLIFPNLVWHKVHAIPFPCLVVIWFLIWVPLPTCFPQSLHVALFSWDFICTFTWVCLLQCFPHIPQQTIVRCGLLGVLGLYFLFWSCFLLHLTWW